MAQFQNIRFVRGDNFSFLISSRIKVIDGTEYSFFGDEPVYLCDLAAKKSGDCDGKYAKFNV